jgi:hypothetical protein
MVRAMNQRVGLIVLALFVTCFVGSLALGTITFIGKITDSVGDLTKTPRPAPDLPSSEPTEPDESPPSTEPAVVRGAYVPPEQAYAQYAIFHLERARQDPFKSLQKVAKGTKFVVYRDEAADEAVPPYLVLRDLPVDDYPVPDGEPLDDGAWITPAMRKSLVSSKRATVVDAVMPLHDDSLLSFSKVMLALVQATGGVLWDDDARDYFSPDDWKKRRVQSWEKSIAEVRAHFTVYVDAAEHTVDLKSGGLHHFGLPELALKSVPKTSQTWAIALLNLVAQTLLEARVPAMPGPLKVRLAAIKHRGMREDAQALLTEDASSEVGVILVGELDDTGPVLEITFPGKGTREERVEAGIKSLLGTQLADE